MENTENNQNQQSAETPVVEVAAMALDIAGAAVETVITAATHIG